MHGTATVSFGQSGGIAASGALVGTAPLSFAQIGTISGVASLAGSAVLLFGQNGTLGGGLSQITGTAGLNFNASAYVEPNLSALFGGYTPGSPRSGKRAEEDEEEIIEEVEELLAPVAKIVSKPRVSQLPQLISTGERLTRALALLEQLDESIKVVRLKERARKLQRRRNQQLILMMM